MNKQHNSQSTVDPLNVRQLLAAQAGNNGGPCVSVQVNLFTAGNMLKQNIINIKKSSQHAAAMLELWPGAEDQKKTLKERLHTLVESFHNSGSAMAIGMFVGKDISTLIEYPFAVNECSIVEQSFEVRDVLYLEQYLEPYYALNIASNEIHLFKGHANSFTEVTNQVFPKHHSEEYEYEHASIGSSHGYSMKGFERDKGDINNIRQESFVRAAARNMASVIDNEHAQLVVAGPARLVNEVLSVYPHPENIVRVNGTFNGASFGQFAEEAWKSILGGRADRTSRAIQRVSDLPLSHKAQGLRDVWEAAVEGRGLMLLVERDFQKVVYQLKGTNSIRLHPPTEEHLVRADGVDDVIEIVREKNGRVMFTEPGSLGKFDGIVLTLRY